MTDGSVTQLFDEKQISRRVKDLAPAISHAISGDFTVVGLLKGSFVFVADLARAFHTVGRHPRVEFMRLSSYGHGRESSGEVQLIGELPYGVTGREVLLVDDVADTGRSIIHAKGLLEKQGASKIWTCALVDKPSQRELELSIDFIGFTVGDVFVVGYGIDYAEQYRHLPYIGTIE